jgi:hypothetical protein
MDAKDALEPAQIKTKNKESQGAAQTRYLGRRGTHFARLLDRDESLNWFDRFDSPGFTMTDPCHVSPRRSLNGLIRSDSPGFTMTDPCRVSPKRPRLL